MSRFKISVQIALGFALAIVLMSASAMIVCAKLAVMNAKYAEVTEANSTRANTGTYLAALVDEETGMRGYVATRDEGFLAPLLAARAKLPEVSAQAQQESVVVPGVSASLAAALQQASKLSAFFDDQIALVHGGHADQAIKNLGNGKTAFDEFRKQVGLTMDQTNAIIADAQRSYSEAAQTVFWTVVSMTLGSVVLLAVFAAALSRYIARRLMRVTAGLQGIVRDDLADLLRAYDALQSGNLKASFRIRAQPIVDTGNDEIADLIHSYTGLATGLTESSAHFHRTTERLQVIMGRVDGIAGNLLAASVGAAQRTSQTSSTIGEIVATIDGVAAGAAQQVDGISSVTSAAEELSRTAAQIASGSADQAAAVQGAGSAVNRLDQQIANFSNLGTSLAGAARSANEQSAGGTAAVRETAAAMTSLRDEAGKTERAMAKLEEKSTAVEEIVSTIDEIADQTNLLALNAAIEAARAGEHGRGFSVVADEVRKLAERAATSTRQINTILSEIRRETNATAAVVRSSVTSMEAGLALASKASDALHNVNTAIVETTRIADDVAQGAKAMRDASAEVTANVSSVSAVIEENAAAAQEMQTTTELLTRAMHPISDLAIQQSAIATQVSASARTLVSLAEATSAGAQSIKERAGELAETVGEFQGDARSRPPQAQSSSRVPAAVR